MEFKLARMSKDAELQTISLKEMQEQAQGEKVFYLDRENKEKDLQKALKAFNDQKRSAKLGKIAFGLDDKDYIFELHII